MKREYFIALEKNSNCSPLALPRVIDPLAFNEHGLIPFITQDDYSACHSIAMVTQFSAKLNSKRQPAIPTRNRVLLQV